MDTAAERGFGAYISGGKLWTAGGAFRSAGWERRPILRGPIIGAWYCRKAGGKLPASSAISQRGQDVTSDAGAPYRVKYGRNVKTLAWAILKK